MVETNPYVGPRPFERGERDRFHGRDREASELLSLITAHRGVLLYARSGAGKSSLLNAMVIPLLEEEGFEVLPTARVQGPQVQAVAEGRVHNVYMFYTLLSLTGEKQNVDDVEQFNTESLSSFLEARPYQQDDFGYRKPRLLIFDQFEELFTAYPQHWQERERFFGQVNAALEKDPLLHVVFAMREDYIAQLDAYADLLPSHLRTRFRLERMKPVAALEAVRGPIAGTGRSFAPGVAEHLVRDLGRTYVEDADGRTVAVEGEFVEPVQLQVVCSTLWSHLPEGVTLITDEHLETAGDVDQALSHFYEVSIAEAVRQTSVREGDLRTWFEQSLITPAGTRGTVYRGPQHTGELPNEAVDVLEDLHLIRGEWRAGARWYELTHDRFLEPIQSSNELWLKERREVEQTRRWLLAKAADWERLGRGSGGLLDDIELREAERWLAVLETADVGVGPAVSDLVAASRAAIEEAERRKEAQRQHELDQAHELARAHERRAEAEAQARRRYRALAAILALFLVAATLLTIYALDARQDARASLLQAAAARATAEANEREAAQARVDAEANAVAAAEAQQQAEAEREIAEVQRQTAQVRQLAAQAVASLDTDPELSLLLALQAAENDLPLAQEVPETADTLHRALDASRLRQRFSANPAGVYGVAISPNGDYVASGGGDSTARLWERSSGVELATFPHGDEVTRLAFSHDGSRVATGSYRSFSLWSVETAVKLHSVEGHEDWISAMAFSPDGNRLVTASLDGTARLWNTQTGTEVALLDDDELALFAAVFAADGTIATGGDEGVVRLWDASGRLLKELAWPGSSVLNLAFNADGSHLAIGGIGSEVTILEVNSGEPVETLDSGNGTGVAFSSDGQTLVTVSVADEEAVRIWRANTWSRLAAFGQVTDLYNFAFSRDGRFVVTAEGDGAVIVYDVETASATTTFYGHSAAIEAVDYDWRGDVVVIAGGATNRANVLDAATGELLVRLDGHQNWVLDAVFSPDGERVATASLDGTARIWDWNGEAAPLEIGDYGPSGVNAVAFSPDGRLLATAGGDGMAHLWDAETAAEAARLAEVGQSGANAVAVTALAFSPNGQLVATADDSGIVRIWDANGNWSLLRRLAADSDAVNALAFTPDGRRLVTGGAGGVARIYEAESGQLLLSLQGHSGPITAVSLRGTILATASQDQSIRLWEATSGRELLVLRGQLGRIDGIALHPTDPVLASGSGDGALRFWDIGFTEEVLSFDGHFERPNVIAFTPDEEGLIIGGGYGLAGVWEIESGLQLLRLPGLATDIFSVAASPDGRRLATGTWNTVQEWDAATGELLHTLVRNGAAHTALAYFEDGERLLAGDTSGQLLIWNMAADVVEAETKASDEYIWWVGFAVDDGQIITAAGVITTFSFWDANLNPLYDLPCRGNAVEDLISAPDDFEVVVIARMGGEIALCDPETGTRLASFDPQQQVVAVGIDNSSRYIVTFSAEGVVTQWDAVTFAEIRRYDFGIFTTGTFNRDGSLLAVSDANGMVRLLNLEAPQEVQTIHMDPTLINDIEYSPNGAQLATAGADGTAKIWDARSGALEHSLALYGHSEAIYQLAYSADGRWLATASPEGTAKLWDTGSGEMLLTLLQLGEVVYDVAFSRDGRYLATAAGDEQGGGVVRVWELAPCQVDTLEGGWRYQQCEPVAMWRLDEAAARSVAFHPVQAEEMFLAFGDGKGGVWLWEAAGDGPPREVGRHREAEDAVDALAFNHVGSQLASGGFGNVIRVWDVAKQREVATMSGHTGTVTDLSFSPDGQQIASSSWDGTVRVWDGGSGTELLALKSSGQEVLGVAFHPTGQWLASSGEDGSIRVYTLETRELVALARSRVTRELTWAECQLYLGAERCVVADLGN